jgi:hypothetical protein
VKIHISLILKRICNQNNVTLDDINEILSYFKTTAHLRIPLTGYSESAEKMMEYPSAIAHLMYLCTLFCNDRVLSIESLNGL